MERKQFEVDTSTFEQREPVRAPSVHSDVLVPFWRALMFGAIVGLFAVLVALLLEAQLSYRGWALLFGVPAVAVMMIVLVGQFGWSQQTLWRTEERTGRDLDHDGKVGNPAELITVNQYGKTTRHELSAEREKARFLEFVRACYDGNTSVTTLTRRGFVEAEIDRYRAILMRPDVAAARWKSDRSHQLGWQMVKPQAYVVEVAERGIWRKPAVAAPKH